MRSRINDKVNIKIPVIGKIKVGDVVSKNGKEYPTSLDYFRATGDFVNDFKKVYGEKPNKIQIAFLSDNNFDVCYERLEIYKGSRLYARGDGRNFHFYSNEHKGFVDMEVSNVKSFMSKIESLADNKWSRVLTLRFMIRGINGILGVWQFDTRAEKSTIDNIIGSFDKVKELGGTVTRTLFDLKVEKVTSNKYGNSNKFPVVTLIPNMTAESLSRIKNIDNTDLPLLLNDTILSNYD